MKLGLAAVCLAERLEGSSSSSSSSRTILVPGGYFFLLLVCVGRVLSGAGATEFSFSAVRFVLPPVPPSCFDAALAWFDLFVLGVARSSSSSCACCLFAADLAFAIRSIFSSTDSPPIPHPVSSEVRRSKRSDFFMGLSKSVNGHSSSKNKRCQNLGALMLV